MGLWSLFRSYLILVARDVSSISYLISWSLRSAPSSLNPFYDAFDETHGRLVRRRAWVCPEASELDALRDWPEIRNVLAIETIRSVAHSHETQADVRYYLTSCDDAPEVLIQAVRRHWAIKTACIGYWMSPSGKTIVVVAIKWQRDPLRCYARWRSTSSGTIRVTNSACVGSAKTPDGTMTIWLICSSDAQKISVSRK